MTDDLQFPRIFLLPTQLEPRELHHLEESVPSLTYDIREADVVVGKLTKRQRAEFELRRHKLEIRPFPERKSLSSGGADDEDATARGFSSKRRKIDTGLRAARQSETRDANNVVQVLKLSWLTDCLAQGKLLPVDEYLLFEGSKIAPESAALPIKQRSPRSSPSSILQRATKDTMAVAAKQTPPISSRLNADESPHKARHPPPLIRQTTSENEIKLPDIPDFLHTTYSCQRPTPVDPPNDHFIQELKGIRKLRRLQGDQIGVRAYSTSIAALAAYPYKIQSPHEIDRLPGCSTRIAELYQQWSRGGRTNETIAAASDSRMSVLQLFYDIWGVGDTTAREFYKKGWRDLDDIVEYGWHSLSRVQQIGVKYYDEFQQKISRREVEDIANQVLGHAKAIDDGFEISIVGGYRRGKKESGDVDVVLSHRDETKTNHVIEKLVLRLEEDTLITHTLSLWTKNSERGQLPLAWQGEGSSRGSGFDTLDKAMVVWQDKKGFGANAPHRRVDIIISPWKTVGCAMLGWSGATTFQRDLRRYCKQEKGLKFDSSGIRRRLNGTWVDFEGSWANGMDGFDDGPGREPAPDMETAERRVFEGLGLPWRLPTERCTG